MQISSIIIKETEWNNAVIIIRWKLHRASFFVMSGFKGKFVLSSPWLNNENFPGYMQKLGFKIDWSSFHFDLWFKNSKNEKEF